MVEQQSLGCGNIAFLVTRVRGGWICYSVNLQTRDRVLFYASAVEQAWMVPVRESGSEASRLGIGCHTFQRQAPDIDLDSYD